MERKNKFFFLRLKRKANEKLKQGRDVEIFSQRCTTQCIQNDLGKANSLNNHI